MTLDASNGASAPDILIPPYGGRLIDLLAVGPERARLIELVSRLPSVQLTF